MVDLLPDCSQKSLADWLRRHPGVEVATRDRSRIYREGIAKGAPGAAQVADRWHLLRGLALGLEEFLLRKRPALGKADAPETGVGEGRLPGSIDDASTLSVRLGRPYESIEGTARKRHERLVERWRDIRRLHLAGASVKDIAEWVGTSRSTVYRYRELAEPRRAPCTGGGRAFWARTCPTSAGAGTRAAAAPSASTKRSARWASATAWTR